MEKRLVVAILLLCAFLVGCVGGTPGPTATSTSLATYSPLPTSSPTPSRLPTLGATPSAWPTVSLSPGPAASPTLPVPSPTPETHVLGPPGKWVNLTHVREIHALLREGDYLWAATNGGVVCWDVSDGSYAKYTQTDGLHRNRVTAIARDAQGNKWFGTAGSTDAVSKFDGQSWTTYGTVKEAIEAEYEAIQTTIKENDLWLVDREGHVWIIYVPGVQVYDGRNWVTYQSPDTLVEYRPTAMTMDAEGRIWIATVYEYEYRYGMSVFDGEKWMQYRPEGGLINAPINDMTADGEGNVWCASNLGVSRFDGSEWTNYGWQEGLPSIINRIAIDPSGRVWVATNEGVGLFDGEDWQMYGLADGLSGELVQALAFDEAGRAWFGSYGGYVDSFDGQTWRGYATEDEIASTSVDSLVVDARGRVWLGGDDVLTVFDGRSWEQYTVEDGYPGVVPWGMAADGTGNIWIYGWRGAIRGTHDGTWTVYESLEEAVEANYDQILTTLAPTRMWLIEPPDAIWVNEGRYEGRAWTSYDDVMWDYPNYDTIGAVDGEGRLWFGSRREGLMVFDGQSWTNFNTDNSPLNDNWVREILVDNEGRVWIATFSGLYVVTDDEWQTFTSEDGLADDNILSMAFDHQGRVWLGTIAGISVFDGAEWQSYPVMDVKDILVDEAGNVWAGTLFDGLLIYTAEGCS